jgi:hypothetical protein
MSMRVRLFRPQRFVNVLVNDADATNAFQGFQTEVVEHRMELEGVHTLEGVPGALTLTLAGGGTIDQLTLGIGTDYTGRTRPALYRRAVRSVLVMDADGSLRMGSWDSDIPLALAPVLGA